jgi:hypothetical protein
MTDDRTLSTVARTFVGQLWNKNLPGTWYRSQASEHVPDPKERPPEICNGPDSGS